MTVCLVPKSASNEYWGDWLGFPCQIANRQGLKYVKVRIGEYIGSTLTDRIFVYV